MVIAREMGYSEAEFWDSDPIFFNQVADKFYELQMKKFGVEPKKQQMTNPKRRML